MSPNQPLGVTILRAGKTLEMTVTPEPKGVESYGTLGCVPDVPSVITELESGMPAEKAGLKVGDVIVAINGQPIRVIAQMIRSLQSTKEQPVDVTVQRGTQTLTFKMTPVAAPVEGTREVRYRVGIQSDPTTVTRLPFAIALNQSIETNKQSSFLILELMQKMIRNKVSHRMVEGPIGIGVAVGRAVREEGWTPLLGITAAISLNLGIFNLLPIPILDGGVILLLFIESLMQRDISLRIKERIYQAAFVFLVLFAVMVIYNDIAKQFTSLP